MQKCESCLLLWEKKLEELKQQMAQLEIVNEILISEINELLLMKQGDEDEISRRVH